MTTQWNSKIATIPLLVLCTCALLFGLGGMCDKVKLTVTQSKADEANSTLAPGEHRVEPGRYVRKSGNGDIGIHHLSEGQAGRYAGEPCSGNYVGNWTAGAGGYGPRRFSPGKYVGAVSPGPGRGAGGRLTPAGGGGGKTTPTRACKH